MLWGYTESLACSQILVNYSKTCLKQPLNNRLNKDLNDKW